MDNINLIVAEDKLFSTECEDDQDFVNLKFRGAMRRFIEVINDLEVRIDKLETARKNDISVARRIDSLSFLIPDE